MTHTYGSTQGAAAAQRELDRLGQRHQDIYNSAPNYPHEPKPEEIDHRAALYAAVPGDDHGCTFHN
ncbi:hypothetical protein ACFXDJ_06845 [Streptomyces sp. NPDC059443]|uniref:hypothetical protein n=1 Tax=unclassified Streptomyces TaxID=2593676 RepID=UPI0036910670